MADLLIHQPGTPVVDLLRDMKQLLREVKLVQAGFVNVFLRFMKTGGLMVLKGVRVLIPLPMEEGSQW